MKVINVKAFNPVINDHVELTFGIDYCMAMNDYVACSESELAIYMIGRYASELEAMAAIASNVFKRGLVEAEFEVK